MASSRDFGTWSKGVFPVCLSRMEAMGGGREKFKRPPDENDFQTKFPTRVFKASCILVLLPHCVAAPLALAMGALGRTRTLVICSTDLTPEPRF